MTLRLWSLLATACAGLILARALPAQDGKDQARTLLERAIKAHGGAEKLTKLKAGRLKTKGKIEIFNGLDFTQEIAYQVPDKLRETMEFEINGMQIKTESVFNGMKSSVLVNGKRVPIADKIKDALKDAQNMLQVARLVPLRDKAYELSLLGEAQVNGKPALGLRISKKGSKDVNLYFDKKSARIAKIEARTVDLMSGQEVTEERIITEYQVKDGVPQTKRVVVRRDGKQFLEAEVLEVEQSETSNADFTVPDPSKE